MSKQLINEYRAELDRLRAVSGSKRESVLREAFKDLLKRWGRAQDLQFIPEHDIVTAAGNRIYVDGALVHGLRVPFGYWEAKDQDDDLDAEIAEKRRRGYPVDNIVFEDTRTAVLIQRGHEVARVTMDDVDALLALVTRFFAHERAEIADFNKAVKQFAVDLPHVLEELRRLIAEKQAASSAFAAALGAFLDHARDAINPAVSEDDVREMLIQHVLTEDIFAKVFDNPDFHRQNNVAAELYKLEGVLFGYGEKQRLLRGLQPYYAGISRTAAVISSHSEKQGFLKALYENFYKVYNPKAADRLGVVYTPGEIVRFMIRSADWLVEKHWGKNLIDPGVEILDPATGTGTFVVELLEHFRGDHAKLRHKYKEELHANEIGILPYYVANLNIEATYQSITGQFAEYPNLCLVDTLDNVAALGIYAGHQHDLLASLSDENMERVKRQNRRKISVIIGNPPYNANQQNENDNNKNRTYTRVDQRIKQTYIAASTAQKTKLYDMYARFFRWATDRLIDEGVLAFVTNRSFIDSRTFDGFRKLLVQDFSDIYLVDLGGDYKRSEPYAGGSNVFGIGTGVAICFLVRKSTQFTGKLQYISVSDGAAEDKLSWLDSAEPSRVIWTNILPGADGTWLDPPSAYAGAMVRVASRGDESNVIFAISSLGVVTARDDWVTSRVSTDLTIKANYLKSVYHDQLERISLIKQSGTVASKTVYDDRIKWSEGLKSFLRRRKQPTNDLNITERYSYRPYSTLMFLADPMWSDRLNEAHKLLYGANFAEKNTTIVFTDQGSQKPFMTCIAPGLYDYYYVGAGAAAAGVSRYRYTKSGERVDNITDWALARFQAYYEDERSKATLRYFLSDRHQKTIEEDNGARIYVTKGHRDPLKRWGGGYPVITKDAIFHYVYAVLHDPVYRETYALNLRREFPRVPLYPDFARWAAWGEELVRLHLGYQQVEPWPLTRVDTPESKRAAGTHPKPVLRSDPALGVVRVDADTQLTGVPAEAWTYRLGNRSAIDWVLDQHKEKTPRDPTIRERFNTYRFSDHKEAMIDLLARVVRVSMETTAITEEMRGAERGTGDA